MTTNQIYEQQLGEIKNPTQSDHNKAMWKALREGNDSKHTAKHNGDGTIHVFSFKGEKPNFSTVSNDVFNQIEIN